MVRMCKLEGGGVVSITLKYSSPPALTPFFLDVSAQTPPRVHTIVEDPYDGDAIARDPEVDHVPLHRPATDAGLDMVAGRPDPGRRRQSLEGVCELVDVTIRLIGAPLLAGETPDGFKIPPRRRREPVLSHRAGALPV